MIIDFPNFCAHEIHQRTFDLKKIQKRRNYPSRHTQSTDQILETKVSKSLFGSLNQRQ